MNPIPNDMQGCSSLGELDIAFRADNNGLPNVGVVLIDPRGRRFGFDPLDKRARDELPVAQGYIDCDVLDDSDACQGVVQICGPISGTYKLEVIAQRTRAYSLNILGRTVEPKELTTRTASNSPTRTLTSMMSAFAADLAMWS